MNSLTDETQEPKKYLFAQGYICEVERILDQENFSAVIDRAKKGNKKSEEAIQHLLSDLNKIIFAGEVYEIVNLYPGQRFIEAILERLTSQSTTDAQTVLPACQNLTSLDPVTLANLLNEGIGFKIISSRLYAIKQIFKAEAFSLAVEISERALESIVLLDHQGQIAKILNSSPIHIRGNFDQKLKMRFQEGVKALDILSWEDQEQILSHLLKKAEETADASQQILFLESALKIAKGKLKETIKAKLGQVFASFFRKTVITQRMSLFHLFYEQGLELLGDEFKTLSINALLEEAEKTSGQNIWRKISLYEEAMHIIREIASEKIETVQEKLQEAYHQLIQNTITKKPIDTLRIVIQITKPYLNVRGKEEELSHYLAMGASKIYKKDPDKALEFLLRAQEHPLSSTTEKRIDDVLHGAYGEKAKQLLAKGDIPGLISTAEKAMQVTGSERVLYDVIKNIQDLKASIIYNNRGRLYNILSLATTSKEKLHQELDTTLLKAAISLRETGELTLSVNFFQELVEAKPNAIDVIDQAAITYKTSCAAAVTEGRIPRALELIGIGMATLAPHKEELFRSLLNEIEKCPLSLLKAEKDHILKFGKENNLSFVGKPLADTLVNMTLSHTEEPADTILSILETAQKLSPILKDKPILTELLKQIIQNYTKKGYFTQSHKTIKSAQHILKDSKFQISIRNDLEEIINLLPSIESIKDLIGLQALLKILDVEYDYIRNLFERLLSDCASNAWTTALNNLLRISTEIIKSNDQEAIVKHCVLPKLQTRAKTADQTQSFILYLLAKKIAQKYHLEELVTNYEAKIDQTIVRSIHESIAKSSKYLLETKGEDDLWSAVGSPIFTTTWATLALHVTGAFEDQIIESVQRLIKELDSETGNEFSVSWVPLFLQMKPLFVQDKRVKQIITKVLNTAGNVPNARIYSAGLLAWSLKNPKKQLNQLKDQMQKFLGNSQTNKGFWAYGEPKEEPKETASTLGTSAAILGLADSERYRNNVMKGVNYLLSIQEPEGAIHTENETSPTTTTAYAILALTYADYEGDPLMKAINYLISEQNDDGGWGWSSQRESNPNTTACIAFALSSFVNINFPPQNSEESQ